MGNSTKDRKQTMLLYIVTCVCFCVCIAHGNPIKELRNCNDIRKISHERHSESEGDMLPCIQIQHFIKEQCKGVAVCFSNNKDGWKATVTKGGSTLTRPCDYEGDSGYGTDGRTLILCTKSNSLDDDIPFEDKFDFDSEGSSDVDADIPIDIPTSKPDMRANNTDDHYTAVYVVVSLIIIAAVVLVIVFILMRRRSRRTLHNGDNVPVMEAGPVIPMPSSRDSANFVEYAEIPADAILSSNIPANSYSTVDVGAVDQHEYGRFTKQTTDAKDNYSHLGTVSKTEHTAPIIDTYSHMSTVNKTEHSGHTDNTYSHIDNGADDVKPSQADEPDDDYNKVQREPANRTRNRTESNQNADVEYDPDYSHLEQSNRKSSIESQDDYSHIGQSSVPVNQRLHAKSPKIPDYEIADVDDTKHERTDGDGEDYKIAAPGVDFELKPENDSDGKTAQCSDGQYFVLEKHERETEVETPRDETARDEAARDHQYVILEKQEHVKM